jgi:hypothetical protein
MPSSSELRELFQAKKSTATTEGVRVHPALLPRIATVSHNGALKASTSFLLHRATKRRHKGEVVSLEKKKGQYQ